MSESIGRTRPVPGVTPVGPGAGSRPPRERPPRERREGAKPPAPPADGRDDGEPAEEPERGRNLDVRV